jgi:hypothetical protein
MAYVVVRPRGRFEIRESVHTPNGPRARSLANFAQFNDEVLEKARQRASRPFDSEAVRAAATRVAATRVAETQVAEWASAGGPRHEQPETRRFVEASRRMARSVERVPAPTTRQDPGDALIDLLGLVARVGAFGPPRNPEPLRFPPLARLRAAHAAGTGADVQRPR